MALKIILRAIYRYSCINYLHFLQVSSLYFSLCHFIYYPHLLSSFSPPSFCLILHTILPRIDSAITVQVSSILYSSHSRIVGYKHFLFHSIGSAHSWKISLKKTPKPNEKTEYEIRNRCRDNMLVVRVYVDINLLFIWTQTRSMDVIT